MWCPSFLPKAGRNVPAFNIVACTSRWLYNVLALQRPREPDVFPYLLRHQHWNIQRVCVQRNNDKDKEGGKNQEPWLYTQQSNTNEEFNEVMQHITIKLKQGFQWWERWRRGCWQTGRWQRVMKTESKYLFYTWIMITCALNLDQQVWP